MSRLNDAATTVWETPAANRDGEVVASRLAGSTVSMLTRLGGFNPP
jgi:hypothetical protein